MAIDAIRPLVAEVREVDLPNPEQLGRLIDYEGYAFHAQDLARTPERYDARTRATILEGKEISEAEGTQLRRELEQHRAKTQETFARVDLVMLPTLPSLPLLIRDATTPFAQPACTFAFSLGGLPAMSVPCGYSRSGLPIGVLIGGPPLSEPHIFALAQTYEGLTDWSRRRPTL